MKDKLKKKGVWITHFSKDFWIREDLSLEAKAIYAIIKCYANNETLEAFPSLPLLVKVTGKNRVTIQKYIKELEEKDFMKKLNERKEDGTYKNNIYTIVESEAEKVYNEEDLTKAKNIAFGKNADLSKDKIYRSGKTLLITDIYQYLNNSLSIAQFLITDYEFFDENEIAKLDLQFEPSGTFYRKGDELRLVLQGRYFISSLKVHQPFGYKGNTGGKCKVLSSPKCPGQLLMPVIET